MEDELEKSEFDPPAAASMDDLLKHLRARRYQTEETSSLIVERAEVEDASSEEAGGPPDESDEHAEEFDFGEAFNELGQEVRRVGRELFKAHRAAEGNQELFTAALDEIRQLTNVVAQIPAQNAESLKDVKFEAKAGICRELLRMADTLDASVAAADDLLERLENQASQPGWGIAFYFADARKMRESLNESVVALRQWRDGQMLLAERLAAVLQSAGVRPIEAAGSEFDPALHRAVSSERRGDRPSGAIIGEELRGYLLEGKVLRYSEVIVVKNE